MEKELEGILSNTNDIEELLTLASDYYNGKYGDDKQSYAYALYQKALEIDPENARAINGVGRCYDSGTGIEKNEDTANTMFRRAAERNNAAAEWNLAKNLRDRNDPECLEWFEKACEHGDEDAAYELAKLYILGEIVEVDHEKYIQYLKKASEMGNRTATGQLACEYYEGECIEKDIREGYRLMEQAANAGDLNSINNMVTICKNGDGTEQDLEKAIEWAEKAAELGDPKKLTATATHFLLGIAPYAEDKERAYELYQKAAKYGDSEAMRSLGSIHYAGNGVKEDREEGIQWWEQAGRNGNMEAMDMLLELCIKCPDIYSRERYYNLIREIADDGYYYAMVRMNALCCEGIGTEPDPELGKKYLEEAAKDSFPDALREKARNLYFGQNGYEQDRSQVVELFTAAAEKGDREAAFQLGTLYKTGDLVEKDIEKAAEMYEQAGEWKHGAGYAQLGMMFDGDEYTTADYPRAREALEKASALGNPEAKACLANMYREGHGVEKDPEKGFLLAKEAADHNNGRGAIITGLAYYMGEGVEKDVGKALEYFEKAYELGYEQAETMISAIYVSPERDNLDPIKVFQYDLKKAEAGDAEAQFFLSCDYHDGIGVEKNDERSRYWLRESANNGYAGSQYLMGRFLQADGNPTEAVPYISMAADNGDAEAQCEMAEILINGYYGVPQDIPRAIGLLQNAIGQGSVDAMSILGRCYMTGNGVPRDYRQAEELFRPKAEAGDVFIQYMMGEAIMHQENGKTRSEEAIRWYTPAAETGLTDAMNKLAALYSDSDDRAVYMKAVPLWEKVLEDRNYDERDRALIGLSYIYSFLEKDPATAFPYHKEAAEKGYAITQYELANCYYKGLGTAKDTDQALYWAKKAADQGFEPAASLLEEIRRSKRKNYWPMLAACAGVLLLIIAISSSCNKDTTDGGDLGDRDMEITYTPVDETADPVGESEMPEETVTPTPTPTPTPTATPTPTPTATPTPTPTPKPTVTSTNTPTPTTKQSDYSEEDRKKQEERDRQIREIATMYNQITAHEKDGTFSTAESPDGIIQYYDDGEIVEVYVPKNGTSYERWYYYNNGKVFFSYYKGEDTFRFYFYNGKMIEVLYCSDASNERAGETQVLYEGNDFDELEDAVASAAYYYYTH